MITITAPAKINLTLDVIRRMPSGYHELKTVFQAIDLCDELRLTENKTGKINLTSNSQQIPLDESNLVSKAVDLVRQKHKISKGINVQIEKKIPVAAGMAGGSTNAGATLKALNKMWNLKLSVDMLMNYGAELGMDVPFTILGGTALGTHFGEELKPLANKLRLNILTVTPEITVSTKEAYQSLDLSKVGAEGKRTDQAIAALRSGDLLELVKNIHNDFEKSIMPQYPVIGEIKKQMLELGAVGSLMSGSGPTVFGIWQSKSVVHKAFHILKNFYQKSFLTQQL